MPKASETQDVVNLKSLLPAERLRRHLRTHLYVNAYYLMASSLSNAGFGFVFWTVVARFYDATEVGLAAALLSAATFLATLATLGLGTGLIRFLPEARENGNLMLNSSLTIVGLASVVAAAAFLVGFPLWFPALASIRSHPSFLAGFLLLIFVLSLYTLVQQAFVAERAAKFVLVKNITAGVIKISLPITFAVLFGMFGILIAVGSATIVATLLSLLLLLPTVRQGYLPFPALRRDLLRPMVRYSLGNHVAHLLWTVPTAVLPLIVVNVLGAETNAVFYIAWMIAGLLSIIPIAVADSSFAEGSHNEALLYTNVWRAGLLALTLLVPAIAFIFGFGDKVLLLFGRPYSERGTTLLWLLAVSAVPMTINILYLTVNKITKRVSKVIAVSGTTAWLGLIIACGLMPRLGLTGVGIGWLLGQSVVATTIVVASVRRSEVLGGTHE